MKRYLLVRGPLWDGCQSFQDRVNAMARAGWEPLGGISADHEKLCYIQAMVREAAQEEDDNGDTGKD